MAGGGAELVRKIVVQAVGETAQLDAALNASGRKVDDFKKRNTDAATGATSLGNRYAVAARTIASGSETIARTGKLGGEAMKQLITQGSLAATFFGPEGAIVGAIGISTLAMVHLFNRAAEEAKKSREKIQAEFQKLATLESVTAAAKEAERLQLGTARVPLTEAGRRAFDAQRQSLRGDAAGFGAAFGLQGIREELAAIEKRRLAGESLGLSGVKWREQLIEKEKELAALNKEALDQIARLGVVEAGRAQAAARTETREDAAAAAEKLKLVKLDEPVDVLAKGSELVAKSFALLREVVTDPAVIGPILSALDDLQLARIGAGDVTGAERVRALREQLSTQRDIGVEMERQARADEAAADFSRENLKFLDQHADRVNAIADEEERRIQQRIRLEREARAQTIRNAQAFAFQIQQGANGAIQMLEAFGGITDETGNALRNLSQIATSIQPLLKAIEADNYEGRTADILSGALSITGAISALAQSFVSGSSRVDAAVDAFTAAVERLHESLDAAERATRRPDDPRAAALFDVETEIGGFAEQAFDAIVKAGGETLPRGNFALQGRWREIMAQLTGTLDDIPVVQALLASSGLPTQIRALLTQYLTELQRINALRTTRIAGVDEDFAAQDGPGVERTTGTASSVSRATEVQFDRSLALDTARNAKLDVIIGILQQGLTPITAPALPGSAGFTIAGGATFTFGDIIINVAAPASGGVDVRAIGDELYREITRRLAEEQQQWSRHNGVVS